MITPTLHGHLSSPCLSALLQLPNILLEVSLHCMWHHLGIYVLYRSRCHGNRHLNDFKSLRIILIASLMILNPVDVHGGQSACIVYMTPSQPLCICCNMPLSLRAIPTLLVELPPYKVVLRTDINVRVCFHGLWRETPLDRQLVCILW